MELRQAHRRLEGVEVAAGLGHSLHARSRTAGPRPSLFDLAIDSKLRVCDVVKIKIGELVSGGRVRSRAIVVQRQTGRPVQFKILELARTSILAWLDRRGGFIDDSLSQAGLITRPTSAPDSTPGG